MSDLILDAPEKPNKSPLLEPIKDNSQRAKNLVLAFWIVIAAQIAKLMFQFFFRLDLLERLQAGEDIPVEDIDNSDLQNLSVSVAVGVFFIMSAVFFILWFRRAYANLHRLRLPGLKYEEAQAAWAWFVPILSLFRPVQIMNEIWDRTQEKLKSLDGAFKKEQNAAILVVLWWGLFVMRNIADRVLSRRQSSSEIITEFIGNLRFEMILNVVSIIEAILVIVIVKKLSKIETKLYDAVQEADEIQA